MKRFGFALDPYLALLQREMEAAEAQSAELQARQQAARRRSEALLQQRQAALQRLTQAEPIPGGELRGLDAWRAASKAGKQNKPLRNSTWPTATEEERKKATMAT
jgi:hypothetical protein